jgi:hypothetical protein
VWPAWVLLGAAGLLLAQVSAGGGYLGDLVLSVLLFGLGLGGSAVAALTAVFTGVAGEQPGVGSEVNTAALQVGGALGVAITTTMATSRTAAVLAGSAGQGKPLVALTEGFRAGFMVAAGFTLLGLLVAATLLSHARRQPDRSEPAPAVARD